MKYQELTHKIIGCAMKVHSTLGNGFQEVIYQRALAIEMEKQGLRFAREMEMTIFYEGIDIGTRRVDFFVEHTVMVELKALIKLRSPSGSSNELLSGLQFTHRAVNQFRSKKFGIQKSL